MRFRNVSIKYSYIIIILLIIFPIFIFVSASSYFILEENIIKNANTSIKQSRNFVIETIAQTERSNDLVASFYNDVLKESLDEFKEEYKKAGGDLSKVDINILKEKNSSMLDYYIIDSKGKIIKTTSSSSLGVDYGIYEEFDSAFTKIIEEKRKTITSISKEVNTDNYKKWAYIPTDDQKYILEIGLSGEKLKKYINILDYEKIENTLIKNNQYIEDVVVFNSSYEMLYNSDVEIKEPIKSQIDKVLKSKQSVITYDESNFIVEDLIYHDLNRTLMGEEAKVIAIYYKYDGISNQLRSIKNSFVFGVLFFGFIALFVMWKITSKYITNPLADLSERMRHVSYKNLSVAKDVIRGDEIGQLENSFNMMVDKIKNTIISRAYFENIINSAGDILVILDENMNIKMLNIFATKLLGYEKNELLGAPISVLFEDDFVKQNIMKKLETSMTVEGIENSVVKSNRERVPTFISISKIENDNNTLTGYVLTAKDMTTVRANFEKLELIAEKLEKEKKYLTKISNFDPLTGIYNRRKIFDSINSIVDVTKLNNSTFSILMIDVDYFKSINDKHGHQIGDKVLIEVSNLLVRNMRKNDLVGRYGGEEFLVILNNQNLEGAHSIANRIRENIEQNNFSVDIKITTSIGVAQWDNTSISDVIRKADQNLYIAKKEGRNLVR